MDELFEALTLIQTQKVKPFPIIVVNRQYWSGLFEWMKNTQIAKGFISKEDFDIFSIVETPSEVISIIENFGKSGKKKKK